TLKKIIPIKFIDFIYNIKPEIHAINIYLLKDNTPIVNLHPIDKKFIIRELNINDTEKLKTFYVNYKHVLPRLKDSAWIGLAAVDTTNEEIAYISWVIKENIEFIKDFKIKMNNDQFMVRHGVCKLIYRHQGIHTRMEQERLNYCFRNGAKQIYVHIASKNKVGIATLINAGYEFYQRNLILRIPYFGVHRELFSALKAPFNNLFTFLFK
ncbi:hypothetical protein ACFLSE_09530, partial [Bacteroidota bacterium]